jgi:hypothetical protein
MGLQWESTTQKQSPEPTRAHRKGLKKPSTLLLQCHPLLALQSQLSLLEAHQHSWAHRAPEALSLHTAEYWVPSVGSYSLIISGAKSPYPELFKVHVNMYLNRSF